MKRIVPIILLLLLASCAPVNEDQCRAGNWQAIGLRDGINGRSESFVAKIADECAKFGIRADPKAWSTGRTQGLKTYCTVDNAENAGRNGHELSPVCGDNPRLEAANNHGKNYYALTQKLNDLEEERDELEAILHHDFNGEITPDQRHLARHYVRRLENVRDDIREIRRALTVFPHFG